MVPAVDGKSVLDGSPATPNSMGYIVPAWGSIRIPGWTLNGNEVAKFKFDDKEQSYAARMSNGSVVQSGVIGVLVYEEKVLPKPVEHHHHHWPSPTIRPIYPYDPYIHRPRNPWMDPIWASGTVDSRSMASIPKDAIADTPLMGKQMSMNAIADVNTSSISNSSDATSQASSTPFEMGTGFGERMDFKVDQKLSIVGNSRLRWSSIMTVDEILRNVESR